MKTEINERLKKAFSELYNCFHHIDEPEINFEYMSEIGYDSTEVFNMRDTYLTKINWYNQVNRTGTHILTPNLRQKGFFAVVEYLCELDGIPNVMDYTCLFETENEKPKYELRF